MTNTLLRAGLGLATLMILSTGCDDAASGPADVDTPGDDTASATDVEPDASDTVDATEVADDLEVDIDTSPAPNTCAPPEGAMRHGFDAELAAHGERLLTEETLGRGVIPRVAMTNLWLAWGAAPSSGPAYWAEVRRRYGLHEAPFDNGDLPLGLRETDDGSITFDCLLCHADTIAGQVVIGAANSRVDLESLYDDLITLNELAPMFGYPQVPVPFELDGFQAAAGVTDSFGLSMELSKRYAGGAADDLNTDLGMQRAAAWWTLPYKDHIYSDGAGQVGGHRTMMAMLLAFGTSYAELQAMDDEMEAIAHYLRSLEPPCWTLTELDAASVERGEAVYLRECASCHGHGADDMGSPEQRPQLVDVATIGTDPTRATQWRDQEADFVNQTWFGQPPMQSTGAYLAQPLVGIWARAPYFHNGSVPDLAGVLDPTQRPTRWQRTGSSAADYDPERVGWRYDIVAQADTPGPDTRQGRLVYDTTRPGLSNAGHPFGADLSEPDRADLLEYLRSQ